MAGYLSTGDCSQIRAVFEQSFDTWARDIIIYKKPLKTAIIPPPANVADNLFGFGEQQDTAIYTYDTLVTGTFKAVIKDSDIESSAGQATAAALNPEMMARIMANPISMKVRDDAHAFLINGETEKVIDVRANITYLINGEGCFQTYAGSSYWVYTLRKTK